MSETAVPVLRLTDQGAALIARAVAQEKLYITRLAMGDGQLANVGSIPGLTAQINERVSVPITKTARKGNMLTVSGEVALAFNVSPFRWREVSLHGRIGNEAEVLMGYLYNGENGEMVSPADGVERSIYITLEIDPAANVEVILAPRDSIDWEQISNPPAVYPPASHTHTADDVGASPSGHKHGAGDITSGILPVTRGGTGKGTALTAGDVGASPSGHKHAAGDITSGILPVARGGTGKDTALTASDVGASPTGHTHTAADVGAAAAGHTHTAADVGAAATGHKHSASDITSGTLPVARGGTGKTTALTASDVGAAAAGHSHTVSEITGAAPKASPEFTGSISLGRKSGTTVGSGSTASGSNTTASGIAAHAEGSNTVASGSYAHSEGSSTTASNSSTHAEGYQSTASGFAAHAEGCSTVASGNHAHAGGKGTIADDFYSLVHGQYNRTTEDFNLLTIGNGEDDDLRSNALRVTYDGSVYGKGSFKTSGADYAEFFEWADANPESQDRIALFVTLEGKKIKIAQPGDYILGIISGNPCIVGNADEDWLGRFVQDDFGRFVREYLETVETEIQPPEGLTDAELPHWMMKNQVEKRGEQYIQTSIVVADHETHAWRHKANPDYDHTQPYVERRDRKEWDCVGMLGVLAVLDDGSCQVNGFCKVAEGGIATAAEGYVPGLTYRVIERVADNIIKVIFR